MSLIFKYENALFNGEQEKEALGIGKCFQLLSTFAIPWLSPVMPSHDPWNRFYYPTFILVIDSNFLVHKIGVATVFICMSKFILTYQCIQARVVPILACCRQNLPQIAIRI